MGKHMKNKKTIKKNDHKNKEKQGEKQKNNQRKIKNRPPRSNSLPLSPPSFPRRLKKLILIEEMLQDIVQQLRPKKKTLSTRVKEKEEDKNKRKNN